MNKYISPKTVKRLSLYHSILEDFAEKDINFIASTHIAELLRIDQSQVRKDLQILESQGKCKVGYNVKELKTKIEHYLGFEKPKNAFIVGAGNLAWALAKYSDFENYGLNITAMYDIDPMKINLTVNGKRIFHVNEIKKHTEETKTEIIILTVPRSSAQQTADLLSETGIKYIWNFTPAIIKVPEHIEVWNENLMGSFLQFTFRK